MVYVPGALQEKLEPMWAVTVGDSISSEVILCMALYKDN